MPEARTSSFRGRLFNGGIYSSRSTLLVVCITIASSYLVPSLVGLLVTDRNTVWPLWPGCAILVTGLLLVPVKVWLLLIPASFFGFAIADLQAGVPLSSIARFIPGNTVEVLISAIGLRYCFSGVPRLNSVRALLKYSFFAVVLAPSAGAFFSASGIASDYWRGWKIVFLSEMLAFLTVTPALLSWITEGRVFLRRPRSHRIEGGTLIAGLALVSCIVFTLPEGSRTPALFYTLVPFLLWSALRFGWLGVSTSLCVVTFLSIWGAVYGRGPFSNLVPLSNPLPLQLFLIFVSIPFLVLSALATEGKCAEHALRETNDALEAQTGALRSQEELLKIFVKNVPAGVAMLDSEMRYLQVSDRWSMDYGASSSQLLGRSHYEVFPDVPQRWKEMHRRALEGETLRAEEDRWEREDGKTVWVRWEIRPWMRPSGVIGGILIFAEDITRRKQMEEAISGVSGRLIEAQERERGRIARELHDDICQQLALVSIELEQVRMKLPNSVAEQRSQVEQSCKRIMDICTDVQMISHELHSTKLAYLGAAVAMKGFCKEFSEHHKLEIEFGSHDLPSQLSPDVALCLFRVLQEALQNAAKHSGVKRFEVQLWGTSEEVHLTVSDLGSGFNTKAAMQSPGLGLTSMQERVRLVNGKFDIESKPDCGTTIHVRVPLVSEHQEQRAAG